MSGTPPMSRAELLAEARHDLNDSSGELHKLQRRVNGLRKLVEGLEALDETDADPYGLRAREAAEGNA